MCSNNTSKSNIGSARLDENLLYLLADLASHIEVDEAATKRVNRYLTTSLRTNERTSGIKVGRHVLLHLNVWLQVHGLAVQSIERSSGGQQS